jgi:hypothetical protein
MLQLKPIQRWGAGGRRQQRLQQLAARAGQGFDSSKPSSDSQPQVSRFPGARPGAGWQLGRWMPWFPPASSTQAAGHHPSALTSAPCPRACPAEIFLAQQKQKQQAKAMQQFANQRMFTSFTSEAKWREVDEVVSGTRAAHSPSSCSPHAPGSAATAAPPARPPTSFSFACR